MNASDFFVYAISSQNFVADSGQHTLGLYGILIYILSMI